MKNLVFLFTAFILGIGTSFGASMGNTSATFGNSRSFIFTEADVTFSVYPDGEFDFYLDGQFGVQAGVFGGQGAITYNSGFNYNPYVQYDDYGAVIQIAQLPVFYDYYGRVSRIGNIHMNYRSGRLYRLGGMRIYYNGFGYYNYHVGYVNPFNRVYVYQPYHRYFVRPAASYCMVYPQPYRRYYTPVRYTYYRPYYNNTRRAYAHVGKHTQYQHRAERSSVYKNDRQVVARTTADKRSHSRSIAGRNSAARTSRTDVQRGAAYRSASVTRANTPPKKNRSVAAQRTQSRKATAVAKPSRSIRQSIASRSAAKEGVSAQKVNKKRSSAVRRSGPVSKETVSRTSRTSKSRSASSGRASLRSTGY